MQAPQHAAHPLDSTERRLLHAISFFRYEVKRSAYLLRFRDPRKPKNSRCPVLHLAARHGSNSGNHLSAGLQFSRPALRPSDAPFARGANDFAIGVAREIAPRKNAPLTSHFR